MVDLLDRWTYPRVPDRRAFALAALTIGLLPALAATAQAASPVPLGTADSFALLAGSTITNTGATTITGDIGLCCTGVATTGFGPGANQVNQTGGAQYIGTGSVAATAEDDLDIAYADAAGRAVTRTLAVDLSLTGTPATPLLPGVYESTAHGAFQINTSLTLDFQGDPNAVFIFQGTELTTAAGLPGSIRIVNGGANPSTCNIIWQLSDATQGVTLGAGSAFKGTTMALGASVLGTGATVEGRILTRRSKAVNLHTNTIRRSACAAPPATAGGGGTPAPTTTSPPVTPTPAPVTPALSTIALNSLIAGPAGGSPQAAAGKPGTAQLSAPSGPVTGPFTISVTGKQIQSVTFYVDDHKRATVKARPGRTKFTLKIDPRRQSHRVHRVTARVRFKPASRTPVVIRRATYVRPPLVPRTPHFTG